MLPVKANQICDNELPDHYHFVELIGEPLKRRVLIVKRFADVICALIGGVIALPIILLFAVLVKLTSKGPMFFRQERVGLMGVPFQVIKLRSMYQNAEAQTGAIWARKNDSRITPVGRFMRKTRIDELPQFWNVLVGDMSLVGPRPERTILTEKFSESNPEFAKRLRIIPGITGYAQVNGGYDISPDEKCKLDNYYIEHYSLWFDMKLLMETIKVIFTGDGAR